MSRSLEEDKFGNHFRDRFESWEDVPPADGWEKLNQRLDAKDNFNKRWYALSALLLLLLTGAGYYFIDASFTDLEKKPKIDFTDEVAGNNQQSNEEVNNSESQFSHNRTIDSAAYLTDSNYREINSQKSQFVDTQSQKSNEASVNDRIANSPEKAQALSSYNQVSKSLSFSSKTNVSDELTESKKVRGNSSDDSTGNTSSEVVPKKEQFTDVDEEGMVQQATSINERDITDRKDNDKIIMTKLENDDNRVNRIYDSNDYFKSDVNDTSYTEEDTIKFKHKEVINRQSSDLYNDSTSETILLNKTNSAILGINDTSHLRTANSEESKSNEQQGYRLEDKKSFLTNDSLALEKSITNEEQTKEEYQVEDKKEENESNWSLLLAADVNYNFKRIMPQNDLLYISSLDNLNEFSMGNVGYEFSFSARYKLSNRTSISGGVSWLNLRDNIVYSYTPLIADSAEVINVTPEGFEVNTFMNASQNEVQNSTQYVGINIGFLHRLKLFSVDRSLFADFRLMKLISSQTNLNQSGHVFDRNIIMGSVQMGVENPVNIHGFLMVVSPYLELPFTSMYNDRAVYLMKGSRIGISLGIPLKIGHKK
ncbi:hypothetical protein GCM10011506_08860 [Marivirga lumbricoides]|uniref:Outer membrane protein beta-barrel domain-containing protein n=1 Tax=Marivirga lumbricoides TaxID=1046115 RepID=A0ABQ1LK63_9BACT|nr:hypothetical protein GCM10011506_08860 [Marivirga lumbricoides]